jgi:RHS repeat-associated protein
MRKLIISAIVFYSTIFALYSQEEKKPYERLNASAEAHQLQNNVGAPDVSANELINLNQSGDVSFSIPIYNVRSRRMSFPITANYQAGIKVDQKASEIGLGWSINFGSIVRDYGAFEPDYAETSVEAKMAHINANGTASGAYGILDNPGGNGKPYSNNNKDLIYNNIVESSGSDYEKMTPDLYHVTIPGRGGNSFWNNGNPNEAHDFFWREFKAWKISHDVNNFEIAQELSLINELSYLNTLPIGQLDNPGNIAAAICIPPYVKNRNFRRTVPEQGVAGQPNFSSTVKYDDFGAFTIKTEDGTQYIFGKPLRGQKYLFTDDPFWSTLGCDRRNNVNCNSPDGAIYGEWWKIDFIAEWLLTEIRSADYFDANNNNKADEGDEGDWIRIEYTTQQHREWLNFTQTDVASSLMRERAYVQKIVTPIEEVDFTTSKRFDVDHDYFEIPLNNPDVNQDYIYQNVKPPAWKGSNDPEYFHIHYPIEIMRYDTLVVKERLKENNYGERDNILSTIIFDYAAKGSSKELAVSNYLIRNNEDKETVPYKPAVTGPALDANGNPTDNGFNIEHYKVATGRGKTTLLGVDFIPGGGMNSDKKQSYKFEYDYNPSFNEIHKYEIIKTNSFPSVRQSDIRIERKPFENNVKISLLPFTYTELEIEYCDPFYDNCPVNTPVINNLDPVNEIGKDELGYFYAPDVVNKGRNAWSLSKITFPTQGSISLEYEMDHFEYLSDRSAWQQNGALIDNALPFVAHYNKIALVRSLAQAKINFINDNDLKVLYRLYNMPLNPNSGGLRLKKKVLNDGINPPVSTEYQYGPGHYTSVPGSYWSNYIEGFSSFLQKERHNQESSQAYDILMFNPEGGFSFGQNDFSTYMAPLSLNIRIDNTVKENHYYEYIDEKFIENPGSSENAPFVRYKYGLIYNDDQYKEKQKSVAVKGYDRFDSPLIEVITNEVDYRGRIGILKVEKWESLTDQPYSSTKYYYNPNIKAERSVRYKGADLGEDYYPTYTISTGGKLIYYQPPSKKEIQLTALIDFVSSFNPYYALNVANPIEAIANYRDAINALGYNIISSINDNTDYQVPGFNLRRHQSFHGIINRIEFVCEGIETIKTFSYEPEHGLLKEEKSTNSKKKNNGTTAEPSIITEYQYGFEANNIGHLFNNKHVFSQVVGIKTRLGNTPSQPMFTNIIKSSTQNFQGFNTNGLFATSDYEYKTPVLTSGPNAGLMVNYVNFMYGGAPNAPNWEERARNRQYNRYGQIVFQQHNLLSQRNTYGYNSSVVKASFSYSGEDFDATYTGFEDLYKDNGSLDFWESEEDEFWYDQNISRSFDNNPGYAYFFAWTGNQPPPPSEAYQCGLYQLRVNNYNNSWQIGDPILFKKNLDDAVNFTSGTVDFSQTNLPDFETSITHIAFVPVADFGVANFSNDLVGYTDWNDLDHIICIDPPLPSEYRWHFGINIEKINNEEESAISSVSDQYAHNGNYSYRLGGISHANYVPQKSPLRPVRLNPGFSSTYKASVWLRKRLYNPQIPGDILFKYKVWNEDRTAVLDEGENIISDATMEWKYYEMDIPLLVNNSTTYLEVYVENHVEAFDLPENFGIVFIDDLLVYPDGAHYSYTSLDKHLNPTHITDANEKTVSITYDEWGRTKKTYDATGTLLQEFQYFTTDDIKTRHNYIETTTWVDDQLFPFHTQRAYLDGFGKIKQTVLSEPSQNRRLVQSFDYDHLGRLHKTYNTLGEYGSNLDNKIVPDYAPKLEGFYGTNSIPYQELRYYSRPEPAIQTSRNPSGNIGAVTFATMDDGPDSWGEVSFANISYPKNELLKQTVVDENGHPHHVFLDKLGQMIAQKEPIGNSYSFNSRGAILFDETSTFETANTYYEYDAAGNLIKTIDPEGLVTTMTYNSLGQLILETHPDKGSTSYAYDKYSRMRFSQDANDQEYNSNSPNNRFTYYKYDSWDRITEIGKLYVTEASILWDNDFALLNNPDFPNANTVGRQVHKLFEYDADKEKNRAGRLHRERVFSEFQSIQGVYNTPQKTDVYTYEYDANGRVSRKVYELDGLSKTQEINYLYNRLGALSEKRYAREFSPAFDFYEVFEYDELGRLSKTHSGKKLNSLSLDTKYTYDALGKLKRKSLIPNFTEFKENISYQYNIRNQLINQVSERFRTALSYDPKGNITRQVWTNTQSDSPSLPFTQNQYDYYYDALDRLVGANYSKLKSNSNPFLNYYNSVFPEKPDFIYDINPAHPQENAWNLNVASTSYASVISMPQAPSFQQLSAYDVQYYYSKSGNLNELKRFDQKGQSSFQNYNYYSDSGSKTNKLRNLFLTNSNPSIPIGWRGFLYDANGNTTLHISTPSPFFSYKSTYTPFNMPMEVFDYVTGKIFHYRYDANDQRIAKGNREYYLDGVVLNEGGIPKQYAITDGYVELTGFGIQKKYYIKDWLGSVRVVIGENGNILNSRDHYPYGMLMPDREYASGNQEGRRYQFTGHELDGETGYDYHGARYYDREIGRYLGVDPKTFARWSNYNYSFCNPNSFIDPTGLSPIRINDDLNTIYSEGTKSESAQTINTTVDKSGEGYNANDPINLPEVTIVGYKPNIHALNLMDYFYETKNIVTPKEVLLPLPFKTMEPIPIVIDFNLPSDFNFEQNQTFIGPYTREDLLARKRRLLFLEEKIYQWQMMRISTPGRRGDFSKLGISIQAKVEIQSELLWIEKLLKEY